MKIYDLIFVITFLFVYNSILFAGEPADQKVNLHRYYVLLNQEIYAWMFECVSQNPDVFVDLEPAQDNPEFVKKFCAKAQAAGISLPYSEQSMELAILNVKAALPTNMAAAITYTYSLLNEKEQQLCAKKRKTQDWYLAISKWGKLLAQQAIRLGKISADQKQEFIVSFIKTNS